MDNALSQTRARPAKASRFQQGLFVPKNPHKYIGNVEKIRYMSSWELSVHKFFDGNEKVLKWSSEEIAIPYIKPTDGKIHKYYVDYWVEYVNAAGETITEIIEVKPNSQTKPPKRTHKHYLYEQVQYAINIEKWKAAAAFAKSKGWNFRVITEKSIFR